MRRSLVGALSMLLLATACSSSAPPPSAFYLSNAAVDASYTCPKGASNSPYAIHGTVQLHNPTAHTVTIETVRADLTLEAVSGAWLQKIGGTYAASASFGPDTVKAMSDATMNLTIPSACTNPKTGGSASYGDYRVLLYVVTAGGIVSIAASHTHRIATA